MLFLIAFYVYFSLLVAILGRRSRLGFIRSFGLALILTPPVSALVIFLFSPARFGKLPKTARERLMP